MTTNNMDSITESFGNISRLMTIKYNKKRRYHVNKGI